ncbi:hypothetical protein [Streptomyces shenzhenensis]
MHRAVRRGRGDGRTASVGAGAVFSGRVKEILVVTELPVDAGGMPRRP